LALPWWRTTSVETSTYSLQSAEFTVTLRDATVIWTDLEVKSGRNWFATPVPMNMGFAHITTVFIIIAAILRNLGSVGRGKRRRPLVDPPQVSVSQKPHVMRSRQKKTKEFK
jgi:hypothetical protein